MCFRKLTQRFEETRYRRYTTHVTGYRFYDNSSDFIALFIKQLCNGIDVVVRYRNSIRYNTGRYARAIRYAEGSEATAGLYEQAVTMTMVATDKFHDFVATGKATSHAKRTHSCFRTGVNHAHHFHIRHEGLNLLSYFGFQQRRCAIAGTAQYRFLQSGYDFRLCMA